MTSTSTGRGDIVTGIVQRHEMKNVYIDLGKTEAILMPSEQITREAYDQGERIKTFIVEVKKTTKGPQIPGIPDASRLVEAAF